MFARLILTAAMIVFVAGQVVAAPNIPWQLKDWKYRLVVELVQTDPENKVDTALVELAETRDRVTAGGADIRVTDDQGKAVPFQLITRAREPLAGALPPSEPMLIHFQVGMRPTRYYAVYFGNPTAEAAFSKWDKKLGGLVLQTFVNASRRSPLAWKDMLEVLNQSKLKLGEGFRPKIDDTDNPYGADEQFLSVYKGTLFCPVDGLYGFSTASDDSSFMLIDGQLVSQKGPGASGDFAPPGKMELKMGLHKIEYYHAQTTGATLARAGWQPPGTSGIVTIPEQYFCRELFTEAVSLQSRESPAHAYFKYRQSTSFNFGENGPSFVTLDFQNFSSSEHGDITVTEWDFGDGTLSREASPRHVFLASKTYQVKLRCTDKLGFESTYVREVAIGPAVGNQIRVDLRASVDRPVLLPDEAPMLTLEARVNGPLPEPLTLVAELPNAAKAQAVRLDQMNLTLNEWKKIQPDLPVGSQVGAWTFRLQQFGFPVATTRVTVLPATAKAEYLRVDGDRLTDGNGEPVALRVSNEAVKSKALRYKQRIAAEQPVTVVALDDSLAGGDRGGYPDILAELLRKANKNAQINLHRIGVGERPIHNALAGLVDYPPQVRELKGDVVIIAVSLRDVLRGVPVEIFERNLQALVERVAAVSEADIIVVTPPPLVVNPALSRDYANAAKRVAGRTKVALADAFALFLQAGEAAPGKPGWRVYYQDPQDARLFHVAPTAAGQKAIAEALYLALN